MLGRGGEINSIMWMLYRLIDIVLIAIVYVHTVEHYRQMDIMIMKR